MSTILSTFRKTTANGAHIDAPVPAASDKHVFPARVVLQRQRGAAVRGDAHHSTVRLAEIERLHGAVLERGGKHARIVGIELNIPHRLRVRLEGQHAFIALCAPPCILLDINMQRL